MRIIVDADACPVKEEIIATGRQVLLVTSLAHFSSRDQADNVQTIYVDKDKEAADLKIFSLVSPGDLLVTQDYGLAALLIEKPGLTVLHHSGKIYTKENLDFLLASRHQSALLRRQGKHTKGPSAFSQADRDRFAQSLDKILSDMDRD